MVKNNLILQEAIDAKFNPAPYVAEIKKVMNTAKLTKFRSEGECAKLYSAIFMSQSDTSLTFDNWCSIYTALLNDDGFMKNMCVYIALYQPQTYVGMFKPLVDTMEMELEEMHANRVRFLSDAKSFFTFIQGKFNSITTTVLSQVNGSDVVKYVQAINGQLTSYIFYINRLISREVSDSADPDEISYVVRTPLSEDVQDILKTLENKDAWITSYLAENAAEINEAIVNNAKMKVKEAYVKEQKAEKAFDEFVMKKVRAAREKRQNRKHAEMVGEALRINHELKRLLVSLGIGAFSNVWGVLYWVITTVVDKKTDKKDRALLVGQIKDELEIIEEKISQAERNGDDKAKIELIRLRQKLQREYERIQKFRYDPSNTGR